MIIDGKSTFGTEPERIDRLLSMGLEESSSNEAPDPTASLDFFTEKPGGRIGRYKLLRVLGEGGMGIVYLAEQKQPIRRQVALKVIKPGMYSKRVIARFEAERQALALLDHPNIAHVYDAGTTEAGRPYFVMEHVNTFSVLLKALFACMLSRPHPSQTLLHAAVLSTAPSHSHLPVVRIC